MSARICSNTVGKELAALVRGCPPQMKRATNSKRSVSGAASVKDRATEFFTDLNDGIQTTDVANQFDTKCATLSFRRETMSAHVGA